MALDRHIRELERRGYVVQEHAGGVATLFAAIEAYTAIVVGCEAMDGASWGPTTERWRCARHTLIFEAEAGNVTKDARFLPTEAWLETLTVRQPPSEPRTNIINHGLVVAPDAVGLAMARSLSAYERSASELISELAQEDDDGP